MRTTPPYLDFPWHIITDAFVKQVATGNIKIRKIKVRKFSNSFSLGETASCKYIIALIDANNTVAESNMVNFFAILRFPYWHSPSSDLPGFRSSLWVEVF